MEMSPHLCKKIFVAACGMVISLDQKSVELLEHQIKAFNLFGGSASTVVRLRWVYTISICKPEQIWMQYY